MNYRTPVLVLLIFLAGLAVGRLGWRQARAQPAVEPLGVTPASLAPAPVDESSAAEFTSEERRDIEIFRHASPSTVYISQVTTRRSLFSLDATRVERGSGTGFVWDADGHVVTNFHVIQTRDRSTTDYVVTLSDRSEWEGKLIGWDSSKDLAVLRISAPRDKLVPLSVGSSTNLAVGQKVLAVGNPFGLDQTLTTGIVSALGRDMQAPDGRTISDVIQTDAAINPGNSGGPLLDSSGRLIGVNTAIISPSGGYAGIGFAVPVDTVKQLVPQLIRYGKAIRPGIGVSVLNDYQARRYGLEGIVIADVEPASPAARAGLEPARVDRRGRISGDVIVGVDGVRVATLNELQDAFEEAGGTGSTVELNLVNGRERRDVKVKLVEINR